MDRGEALTAKLEGKWVFGSQGVQMELHRAGRVATLLVLTRLVRAHWVCFQQEQEVGLAKYWVSRILRRHVARLGVGRSVCHGAHGVGILLWSGGWARCEGRQRQICASMRADQTQ